MHEVNNLNVVRDPSQYQYHVAVAGGSQLLSIADCRFLIEPIITNPIGNLKSAIGDVESHPPPRGGTDLMSRQVRAFYDLYDTAATIDALDTELAHAGPTSDKAVASAKREGTLQMEVSRFLRFQSNKTLGRIRPVKLNRQTTIDNFSGEAFCLGSVRKPHGPWGSSANTFPDCGIVDPAIKSLTQSSDGWRGITLWFQLISR